jgi:hemolysin activation/secretion protein
MAGLCHVRTALLATLALGAVSAPAVAQDIPNSATPTREEIDRPDLRPTARPPARLTVEGDIERAPCPLAAPTYAGITFTLSDVVFNNLTGLSADELRATYAEFVGRTVPLATVCEIRDRAATALRRRGYLAAVQVPPQEIENGIVRFDVLMAKITRVQVRGDAGRSERTISGFLEALTAMPVFNEKEAERYLLLARDLPGYDVRLTLRPAGGAPGEVIGEVTVLHQPYEVDLSIQNYGTRDVGRFGGQLRAQFNGLTGLGDRTTVGFYTTADFDEQQVVQLFHDFGLGSEGLRLAGRVTHAWTEPGGAVSRELDIKSRTLLASLEATYPFVRSQSTNVTGAIGLDFVNQEVDILGETLNRDKLRILYLRADFDSIDPESLGALPGFTAFAPRWRLGGSFEARQGLGILDATEFCATCDVQPSRVPGTAKGTVFRASAIAEYRPIPNIAFSLAPRVQLSDDPLFAFEEFSAGNYTVGRGYDPGVLVGDSGFGFQSEVRFGSGNPQARDAFAFQPYAFFDAAWVSNRRDLMDGTEKLFSVGAGVRAAYGDRGRIDLTLAVPLEKVPRRNVETGGPLERRPDPRLLISFTTRLLPWNR